MPIFTFPLAFIGLLGVPALVAIYWLRNRARQRQVSSLLLWLDERQKWEGGKRIDKLKMPLLFFLELLAIVMLVMAAAGPVIRATGHGRPLVVVLDDSFSMRAGKNNDARTLARQAIENELKNNSTDSVRFVLAGETPQLLGENLNHSNDASKLLANWRCGAAMAKMEEAIAFAFEIGGSRARILAISDHAPAQELTDSRLQWWAFGARTQNFAIINATRTRQDARDRVLIEVANLAAMAGATTLTINTEAPKSLSLAARETRRILLTLNADAPALQARLSDDVLQIDNEILLVPEAQKKAAIQLQIADAGIRSLVERAVQALPGATQVQTAPDLIISDQPRPSSENSSAWSLEIINESQAASYLGPFVVDRSHPLTDGLALGGVVWGGGRTENLPGTPVITAGNVPLLTDLNRSGSHGLRLRFRPDLSTLQETPVFPILLSNLIEWRNQSTPGLRQSNIRLGSDALLGLAPGARAVNIRDPEGNDRQVPVQKNQVSTLSILSIRGDLRGLYKIDAGPATYAFSVNALQAAESDLSQATSGRWGNWAQATSFEWEYRKLGWIFLLLALMALAVHAWLVGRA